MEVNNYDEVFELCIRKHVEIILNISKAKTLEEGGHHKRTLPLYQSSLNLIDEILSLELEEPKDPNLSWEKLSNLKVELHKEREEITYKIQKITHKKDHRSFSPVKSKIFELPPKFEDALSELDLSEKKNSTEQQLPGTSKESDTYIPLSAVLDEGLIASLPLAQTEYNKLDCLLTEDVQEVNLDSKKEILFSCHNVLLYFISPDGRVSSTLKLNTLVIARVNDDSVEPNNRTFLQVGSWIYPLIPEVSPCIRSDFEAFIFPDINSGLEGAAVGIILPKEESQKVHELFTCLLNEITLAGRNKRQVACDSSNSSTIVKGATYLAHSIIKGAGSTARFFDRSTPKLLDKINPEPEPTPVNPTVQRTVEIAKTISGKTADLTGYLATKIVSATASLGKYLSPHIQEQGTKLLIKTTNMNENEASEKINTMLSYTSDTVEGIHAVYQGLNTAATILGRSLAGNAVQIIEYKYGASMGNLTNDTLATLGNAYLTHNNFRLLKPKGIAKAAVRGAGTALLEDYRLSSKNPCHEEFYGSGPGDGSGINAEK